MISAWFTIGIPAFILSLAPNNERVRPDFVSRVMRFAVPAGVIVTIATFACYLLVSGTYADASKAQAASAALITLIVVMLHVLSVVSRPYEWWKLLLIAASVTGYVVLFTWSWTQALFVLDLSNNLATATGLASGIVGASLVEVAWRWAQRAGEMMTTAQRV